MTIAAVERFWQTHVLKIVVCAVLRKTVKVKIGIVIVETRHSQLLTLPELVADCVHIVIDMFEELIVDIPDIALYLLFSLVDPLFKIGCYLTVGASSCGFIHFVHAVPLVSYIRAIDIESDLVVLIKPDIAEIKSSLDLELSVINIYIYHNCSSYVSVIFAAALFPLHTIVTQ